MKLPENLQFSDDFRRTKTWLICWNLLNIRTKTWRWSLISNNSMFKFGLFHLAHIFIHRHPFLACLSKSKYNSNKKWIENKLNSFFLVWVKHVFFSEEFDLTTCDSYFTIPVEVFTSHISPKNKNFRSYRVNRTQDYEL